MPKLLVDGFPEPAGRSKFDFSRWADGQAWKFVRGEDYDSSTMTFRHNVQRWAKANGYAVELQPFLATDDDGNAIAAKKADPVAVAVRFRPVASGRSGKRAKAARPQAGASGDLAVVAPRIAS